MKKIIIIEDERTLSDALSIKLKKDFSVKSCKNGFFGIRAIIENQKNDVIILLDMQMPLFDGFHVIEFMQEVGIHFPVIILTNDQLAEYKLKKNKFIKEIFLKASTPLEKILKTINSI